MIPELMVAIRNWFTKPDGRSFAESIKKRLSDLDHPETLVNIGTWDEAAALQRFIQGTFPHITKVQKSGALKCCLELIDDVEVRGGKVAGISSKDYWGSFISDAFDARFPRTVPVGVKRTLATSKSFKNWCVFEGKRNFDALKKEMEVAPLRSQQINESRLWIEWGAHLAQQGLSLGSLKEAFDSVGIEIRGGYYGLPDMPESYWPIMSVEIHSFVGNVLSKNEIANGGFLIGLGDCKGEDGQLDEYLNKLPHSVSSATAETIEVGKCVYGTYKRNDKGKISIVTLTHEPPQVGRDSKGAVECGCKDELAFLERLIRYIRQAGFEYEDRDLIRFHTGVKIGLISVLAGPPGSGKSSLVKLYAFALAGMLNSEDEGRRFLRVFVNPTWNQPADLIGEMDPIRNENESRFKFRPAGNGFYEHLVGASDDKTGRIYPVCFEELNLSPVEYYFSDLMQVVDDRSQPLPNISSIRDDDPSLHPLRLGRNVCLCGTCNNDSTTHAFSPRFLDRCNYVVLDPRKEHEGLSTVVRASVDKVVPRTEDVVEADGSISASDQPITMEQFGAWTKSADEKFEEWEDDSESIDSIYCEVRAVLASLEVSPSNRVEEHVKLYVLNRPGKAKSIRDIQLQALDEAIAQMILPACRVSEGLLPNVHDAVKIFSDKFGEDCLSARILLKKLKDFDRSAW